MIENKFQSTSYSQHVWNDYVDFKVTLLDNGDERISMQVSMSDKTHREVKCTMFLPEFKPSKIMLAGSGSATYIKSIRLQ
jgi:hypothetical protein